VGLVLRFGDELAYAIFAGGLAQTFHKSLIKNCLRLVLDFLLHTFVADPGHSDVAYFWLAFLLFFHAGLRFFLRWMFPLTLI